MLRLLKKEEEAWRKALMSVEPKFLRRLVLCLRASEEGCCRAEIQTLRKGHYSPDNDDLKVQKRDPAAGGT